MSLAHYELLADLFVYPDAKFPALVRNVISGLSHDDTDKKHGDAVIELEEFYKLLPVDSLTSMEELYTRSFDVQSATTLDIGYVLFSDDYKRGEVLVHLNEECKAAKVDCGCELSDHLPNVLCLISRHGDKKFLSELVKEFIAPALRKMILEFDAKRSKKRDEFYKKQYKTLIDSDAERATLYGHALKSVYSVLAADFDVSVDKVDDKANDFLASLKREFDTEENPKGCSAS